MLKPDLSMPLLNERPMVRISRLQKIVNWIMHLLVYRWDFMVARDNKRMAWLHKGVCNSKNRQELEGLIGKPVYALEGSLYESSSTSDKVTIPDRVEVYEYKRYVIELWFRDNSLSGITSWVKEKYKFAMQ